MILYSAADLLWATRIKSTADAIGVPCRPVRDRAMLEARLADSDVRGVLLDLEAPDRAWELLSLLRGPAALPGAERVARVVCWGPHVATDLFARSRDLGADAVLTRGAFSNQLPDLLMSLHAGEGPRPIGV